MKLHLLIVLTIIALVSAASAALPAEITAAIANPGPQSYWDVDVLDGSGDIPTANDYIGWCSDSGTGIGSGTYTFKVFSSLGALPAGLPPMDWRAANWIINNKESADMYTIQAAIWHFDGAPHAWGYVDAAEYTRLINGAAAASATQYVPGPGEKYAAILWNPDNPGQPVFIEIIDTPVPEFPTVALPVAMLIGAVGAILFVKTRKE